MAHLEANQHSPHSPYTTPSTFSREYFEAFHSYLRSGSTANAALYGGGGSDGAGGFAIPVCVENSIVPLAAPDSAIRRLATIMPTTGDLMFPIKTSIASPALKPESGSSISSFVSASPTLGSFKLSAFVMGIDDSVSLEFSQDVPAFTTIVSQDAMLGLNTVQESLYLGGNGIGQPQGLLGNVGAGVTGVAPDSNGFLLPVTATYDVLDTLASAYHDNAAWLMQRSTAVALRKAARSAPDPIFTRVGRQDYLHGYPVEYSASMPAVAAGATPVLFGDFAFGYIISQRGGVFMRVLDQTKMLEGLVSVLIYERADGRVRRSEAIQGITLHS